MISGLANSAAQNQTFLGFSWLLPHGHKMAAIAPDITSSCDNIQKHEARGGLGFFPMPLFYQRGKPFPEPSQQASLMPDWLKLGHMPTSKPIIGKEDWNIYDWFGLFLVLSWS